MSVQSRRKPSMLFTATIYGFTWAALLTLMTCCVWGTVTEIRTQTIGDSARSYIAWYFLSLLLPAIIAVCRMGGAEASKRLYLTVQLVNFTVLLGVFRVVLDLAGENGLAFFLGNPVPGIVSTYEAFGIWALFVLGALLLIFAVADGEYRSELWTGIGGILIVIGILMPKVLDSYALLQATCTSLLPKASFIKSQCQTEAIETIPMLTMAIAFAAALAMLFIFGLIKPKMERAISLITRDGANQRMVKSFWSNVQKNVEKQGKLQENEPETTSPSFPRLLSSVAQRHSPCGSLAAAVLGGAIVWMIQAIGERTTKHR